MSQVITGFLRVLISVTLLLILLGDCRVKPAKAQSPLPPVSSGTYPLIEEGPMGYFPQVVTDNQGRVHVFWAAQMDSDSHTVASFTDTIFYRRLEDGVWTGATDILAVGGEQRLTIEGVEVDKRGYLNLLWQIVERGDAATMFLSQAHTSSADLVSAWTSEMIARPGLAVRRQADLTIQSGEKIHLVYVDGKQSLQYIVSEDFGTSWSRPLTVWSGGVEIPRITIDEEGYIHVTWTNRDFERDVNEPGSGPNRDAIFYARSVDDGATWETREIQRRAPGEGTVAFSNVVVRNGDEIHLAWNRGIGSRLGRYHAWSSDNGDTWHEPTPFLAEFISGQTHSPRMVVDSAGVLHLLTIGGGNSIGTHYAYWDGIWSQTYTFPQNGHVADMGVTAAVGLGNILHVVYESTYHDRKLVYVNLDTGALPIPPQAVVTPESVVTLTPSPTSDPASDETDESWDDACADSPSALSERSLAKPVAIAIVPALLLVCIVFIWQLNRRVHPR